MRSTMPTTQLQDKNRLTWLVGIPTFPARAALQVCLWAIAACLPMAAWAVDGCLVMLCLAAPDWKQIPQCVPTIHQLHKHLAMGKPFPSCKDAGPGNNLQHEWVQAPTNCPPQYTHVKELEAGPSYSCDYLGVITVIVNGAPFTRTWWTEGDNVSEFSPAAKAQLGSWNPRFDNDFAAWLAAQPVVPANP